MSRIHLDHAHMRHLLKEMIRIRHFEAKCVELYQAQKILGFLHLYDGEEAVSVGTMQALTSDDAVVATYREHGQALARGIPPSLLSVVGLGNSDPIRHGSEAYQLEVNRSVTLKVESQPQGGRQ